MKTALKTTAFAALLLTPLAVSPAAAQPAPYNEVGATMGHWHIISKDVEANKKLFIAMGGKLYMPPTDIPSVGRFSVIADPQGATFNIIQLTGTYQPATA